MIQLTIPAALSTVNVIRAARVASAAVEIGGNAYVDLVVFGVVLKTGRSAADAIARTAQKAARASKRFFREADKAAAEPILKSHTGTEKITDPAASVTIDGKLVDLETLDVYY